MPVSPARWAAFEILRRVEQQGGFAGDLLHSPITAKLDERDAGLAEELALGVLRWRGELDALISQTTGRDPRELDLEVLLALRMGIYQLRHLERIPDRAAVSESVELVRRARKASATGLANAVLRKAALLPPCGPKAERAIPKWLHERWRRNFGDKAEDLALSTLKKPPTYLRLNPRFDTEETVRMLAAEGVESEATEVPLGRRVLSGRPGRTESFRQGRIRIQDITSQRVGNLVQAGPCDSFLDLCAPPGNKTFQVEEGRDRLPSLSVSFEDGQTVACDLHLHRLLTMRRLATVPVNLVALDATHPLPFSRSFDRILVDAPCSGTGTLARNPEIKWKLTPADIEDLAARQRAILSQALQLLAPGGRLVYSTCSLEPEENRDVVNAVVRPPFKIAEERSWLPSDFEGDGFFAYVVLK